MSADHDQSDEIEVDAVRQPGAPGAKRALLKQALFGLVLLLIAAAISSTLLRSLVESWGQAFVANWGLAGIFVGAFVCDWSPLPLTNEPVMLLGLSGGMTFSQVLWVTTAASVAAGFAGYACGALLGMGTNLRERFLAREGGRAAWVRRYGALGVAVAAFTPIPYALATWMAGLMRIPLPGFALACLVRFPKTLFYLWLLDRVWQSGGAIG